MLIDFCKANIYQADEQVLHDVDFHIDTEQIAYIIGKVGSGKSSLLKSMYCEVDFSSNDAEKAEILGRNLLTIKRKEIPALRREMGIIFQDFQLLHDRNVRQNLEFVLKATGWKSAEKISERIDEVLNAVGMQEMKERLPHELSGGEQQRIAIARALLNSPKIIIADEPTGNLDSDTAEKIIGLLYDISKTKTSVVISTHNLGMIKKFPGLVYKCEDSRLTDITKDFCN